jgi:hypothetical protein
MNQPIQQDEVRSLSCLSEGDLCSFPRRRTPSGPCDVHEIHRVFDASLTYMKR